MELKVGDFYVKQDPYDTEIGVITNIDEYIHMSVIMNNPGNYKSVWTVGEFEAEGWKKFNAEAWYALSQIS